MDKGLKYEAVVIGVSAGGLNALSLLLEGLPNLYPLPLIITQHRMQDQKELLEKVLQHRSRIVVKQADEKELIAGGKVYIAPPGYHLLIEHDRTFSLSADEYVMYSRPSIDVMFESAAAVFKDKLIGIILTGSNSDGTAGMLAIKKQKGLTIAQNPNDAQFSFMPQAAIDAGAIQLIWTLKEIQEFLLGLSLKQKG